MYPGPTCPEKVHKYREIFFVLYTGISISKKGDHHIYIVSVHEKISDTRSTIAAFPEVAGQHCLGLLPSV